MEQTLADLMSSEVLQSEEMEGKYLTFWADAQLFGVPIEEVVQIVGMQEITEIPEFPAYAKGIINLRGTILPVIDIRLRIGKPETAYSDRTCIIVTSLGDRSFGFIVDAVDEVADIDPAQVSPPPQMAAGAVGCYLTGIARQEEKIILLLDAAKLLQF